MQFRLVCNKGNGFYPHSRQQFSFVFKILDFPNEEGKPYKSSGGAMVWNEELKREIPQGWSNMSIGDYAPCKSGYAFKS